MRPAVASRAARYAAVLERMIGPEGTYPVMGRSICYRFGAFQMLAQAALQHRLEKEITPASVRCGLTAVIKRVMRTGICLMNRDGFGPELWDISRNWRKDISVWEAFTYAALCFFLWVCPARMNSGAARMRTGRAERFGPADISA